MAGESLVVAWLFLGLLVAGGGGLVLYALVRREHEDRTVMDRADAERVARQDTPTDPRTGTEDRTDDHDRSYDHDHDHDRSYDHDR